MTQLKTVNQLRRDVAYYTGLLVRTENRDRLQHAHAKIKALEQELAAALAREPQAASK